MDRQHVLLLGGSGISGIAFIKYYLSLSAETRPFLTIYVRSTSKLPSTVTVSPLPVKVRVIAGQLDSSVDFAKALTVTESFPPVTTAISLLGAYITLGPIFTRFLYAQPTPIADAFKSTIIPQLRKHGVQRLLSLSTPTAMSSDRERSTLPWKTSLLLFVPRIIVPQGNEEMKGIAKNTIECAGNEMEWTVFRVPHLTEEPDKGVFAGELDAKYPWNGQLSRDGQAKWLLKEVEERRWVGMTPMLNDAQGIS